MNESFLFVVKRARTIFECPVEEINDFDYNSITNVKRDSFLDPGIEFSVKFCDFSKDALCVFISTDDQKKKKFIEHFCTRVKYKFIEFPFAYCDMLHDHSLEIADNLQKEFEQIKLKTEEIKQTQEELKRNYKFADPMLFDYSIELRENQATKSKFYHAEKPLVLRNAKSKRRRIENNEDDSTQLPETIVFEVDYSHISAFIELGEIDDVVRRCRDALYDKLSFEMLTYQSKPKNLDFLKYFHFDEAAGETITRTFELIIEMAVHLINSRIVEKQYPEALQSKFISKKAFTAVRSRLMANCNAYRSDLRDKLISSGNLRTIEQREADSINNNHQSIRVEVDGQSCELEQVTEETYPGY